MQKREEGQTQDQEQAQELQTAPLVSNAAVAPHWGLAARMVFRLVFAYEIIYSFPFPLNLVAGFDRALGWHDMLFARITVFTGTHILHLSRPLAYSPYAGGDSLFGWVQNPAPLMMAGAGAIILQL